MIRNEEYYNRERLDYEQRRNAAKVLWMATADIFLRHYRHRIKEVEEKSDCFNILFEDKMYRCHYRLRPNQKIDEDFEDTWYRSSIFNLRPIGEDPDPPSEENPDIYVNLEPNQYHSGCLLPFFTTCLVCHNPATPEGNFCYCRNHQNLELNEKIIYQAMVKNFEREEKINFVAEKPDSILEIDVDNYNVYLDLISSDLVPLIDEDN